MSASASVSAVWSNTGKIVVSSGRTLTLGNESTTTWGSVGSISATAATVVRRGQFTTAKFKSLVLSNDTVSIGGRLVNTGTTLALGVTSVGTLTLAYNGTISGGVVLPGSGAVFSGGTLDEVTHRGRWTLARQVPSCISATGSP